MKDLRALRESVGLSQDGLAKLAHTSQPQIDRLEKGKRQLTVAWAKRLAPPLGVKPLDLLPIDVNDGKLSARSKNGEHSETKLTYHDLLGTETSKDWEGQDMILSDTVLAAIGRLAVEVEGLKAELREIKATRAGQGPGKARRR